MADLKLSREGRVAELRLDRNALNTLSGELVDELTAALDRLAVDDGIGAVVLGSTAPKFFSAGWDLPAIQHLDRADFLRFYRRFCSLACRLALLPKPTVAALEGFAVAGGGILALACDWRVMTTGSRRIGLNEVDLGVPLPRPAAVLAHHVAGYRGARDLLVLGHLFTPDEALRAGVVDELADPERVTERAREIATRVAAKPPGAAEAMKSVLTEPVRHALERGREEDERAFLDAWFRPGVRPLLAAAAEKLVPV